MQLIASDQAAAEDLRYLVRSVKVVKLYYITTGRNAWWSTWITRYSPGCMHSTIESAKAFAEQRRVQGTVFYVDELPSLALIAGDRALVVSEINTERFFSRINGRRLGSITSVLPVLTMTLRQMTHMFRPESPLWPSGYPRKYSAILSYCSTPETLIEVTRDDQLSSWASSSTGPKYYMNWSARPFKRGRASLHGLAAALGARLGEA